MSIEEQTMSIQEQTTMSIEEQIWKLRKQQVEKISVKKMHNIDKIYNTLLKKTLDVIVVFVFEKQTNTEIMSVLFYI